MGILGTLIIGLLVGIIARLLKPGRSGLGWIMTIILGLAGSVAATYGGQALGVYQAGQPAGFIGAVVGAIVLLFIVEAFGEKRREVGQALGVSFGSGNTRPEAALSLDVGINEVVGTRVVVFEAALETEALVGDD